MFKLLKSEFDVESEQNERENSGYFLIVSPLDQEMHIETYHHVHQENPYGSIFMALKNVLTSTGLRYL